MRVITAVAATFAIISSCSGLSIPQDARYVLHEKREEHRAAFGLTKRSKIGSGTLLPVRIGLAQRDLHQAYDWVMDIAHPESQNYGKHWTAAQVNKAFAPTADTVTAVRNWLIRSGIAADRIKVSDNKGWLGMDLDVEEAEELFRTQYYEHEHQVHSHKYSVGCDEYWLPEHIVPHVDYITPGVKHSIYKRQLSTIEKRAMKSNAISPPPPTPGPGTPDVNVLVKTVPINCSYYVVDGDCIRALYNLPAQNSNRKVSSSNALGIYEGGENYDVADLDLWIENFAPYIPLSTKPEDSSVDGGEGPVSQQNAGVEALLDITIAYELIYPQTVNVFSVDDSYYANDPTAYGFMDTMLDAIDGSFCTYSAFGQKGNNDTIDPVYPDPHSGGYKGPLQCGTYQSPKVLSVSYTEGEQYLPVNYVERQCNEWMKLALQGTTTVFASGDHGVSFYPGTYGNVNGCLNATDGSPTVFSPANWNECPYILSVGATNVRANVSGYGQYPEEAVYKLYAPPTIPYTSGAGFSNVFKRPAYQDAMVSNYFNNYDPGYPHYSTTKGKNIGANGGLYNRIGRAYPDVAANGAWTHMYASGTLIREGGTSMAAPLVASIINLINEERLAAGKSTVGFVNPTFYGNPTAFHDITIGANQGCGLTYAFNCTPGWDPVTGLGTPNFNKLKQIFMQLP